MKQVYTNDRETYIAESLEEALGFWVELNKQAELEPNEYAGDEPILNQDPFCIRLNDKGEICECAEPGTKTDVTPERLIKLCDGETGCMWSTEWC